LKRGDSYVEKKFLRVPASASRQERKEGEDPRGRRGREGDREASRGHLRSGRDHLYLHRRRGKRAHLGGLLHFHPEKKKKGVGRKEEKGGEKAVVTKGGGRKEAMKCKDLSYPRKGISERQDRGEEEGKG